MDHFLMQVSAARMFAIGAHTAVGQVRKYTGEPYWYHPEEVAEIVATCPHDPEMLAAAWLHDVVEDTGVEINVIWNQFGVVIASYVNWLTNPSKKSDGNRAARKEIDRKHIAFAPAKVKTIKLADLISNAKSIIHHDPKFAPTYIAEMKLLLEVLKEGDQRLYKRAQRIVKKYEKSQRKQNV